MTDIVNILNLVLKAMVTMEKVIKLTGDEKKRKEKNKKVRVQENCLT